MQKTEQEVVVDKEILSHMISDIEHLIDDIETIMDKNSMKAVDKRLNDIKSGKTKGFSERDFSRLMKKDGINAG